MDKIYFINQKLSGSVEIDKENFKDWFLGRITTDLCLKRFKENNKIKVDINEYDFELWLISLGYGRM